MVGCRLMLLVFDGCTESMAAGIVKLQVLCKRFDEIAAREVKMGTHDYQLKICLTEMGTRD